MDPARFTRIDETTWQIEPTGAMRVPGVIYADESLIRAMDDKVYEQTVNVATLPGIVKAAYVMPDAHWGYGFPIGGVAAFDADEGGVVSAGGVGFDVSCGVRTMLTGLTVSDIKRVQTQLADSLYQQVPAGLGSRGSISLDPLEMDAMLRGGARWAIERGWGEARDLDRIEERGRMAGAEPDHVSHRAKERQRREMGTLGSGNHYLEVQAVAEIFDQKAAEGFGLKQDEAWTSDWHRVLARDGDGGGRGGHCTPGSRARLRSNQVRGRSALSRRHARRHQLRSGQPRDHRTLRA
jgi:tRNA-splicing ligase RtcB